MGVVWARLGSILAESCRGLRKFPLVTVFSERKRGGGVVSSLRFNLVLQSKHEGGSTQWLEDLRDMEPRCPSFGSPIVIGGSELE